jgi:hypothetical protein
MPSVTRESPLERHSRIPLGIVAAIGGALAFGFAGNVVFDAVFDALRLGNYKDRYVMSFLAGWIAAFAGVFAGLWLATRRTAPQNKGLRLFFAGFACFFGVLYALTAINYAFENKREFNNSVLDFEIRLPAGTAVPPNGPNGSSYQVDRIDVAVFYGDRWQSGSFGRRWLGREGDRPIIAGTLVLSRGSRPEMINLIMPKNPYRVFKLDLPADPAPTEGHGEWQRVSLVRDPGDVQTEPPPPGDNTELRFRVTRRW